MCLNKSTLTHVFALISSGLGYALHNPYLLNMGLFALSGSLTNALAIYMLFERVPGFYGSGVIPARFDSIKVGIYDMVMEQFFNPDNMARFFRQDLEGVLAFDGVIDHLDLSRSFDAFVDVVLQSSLGGMLNLVGGAGLLESFREPFIERLKQEMKHIAHGQDFQRLVREQFLASMDSTKVHQTVSLIVKTRLDELTPQAVKVLIEKMIREHLGWLVVWGGVLGGLIGLIAAALQL